ncbi:MAG: hypothetical protein R3B07_16195 [Polyangiaceae bacterium]
MTWVGELGGSTAGALAAGLLTASTSTAISSSWGRRLGGGGALFGSWAPRMLGGGGAALRLLAGGGAEAARWLGGGGVLRDTGPVRMDGGGAGAPASPGRGGRGGRLETGPPVPVNLPLGGAGGGAFSFGALPSSICAASAFETFDAPGLDSRGLRFENSSSLDAESRSLIVRSIPPRPRVRLARELEWLDASRDCSMLECGNFSFEGA